MEERFISLENQIKLCIAKQVELPSKKQENKGTADSLSHLIDFTPKK